MAKKNNRYKGVFKRTYSDHVAYGIDYVDPLTKQRIRKVIHGVKSEAEALKLRNIELADAARGAIDKAYGLKAKVKTVSFEDMIDAYIKWSKDNKKSWKTDLYKCGVLKRLFKGKLMSDINPFMIERIKMLWAKDVAKSTVNKDLILGSQVYQKAIEWGKYDGENPFKMATKFKVKKPRKPGSLSPEEVKAIRDEIKHPVKRDMVDFAFNSGWRISEIRNLTWGDVNLEKGVAWIMDPKNNNPVEIDLNDEALSIIARQDRRSDYVFCHINGNKFKTNICDVIKSAAKEAGVYLPPRKAWHIFRRTWASMMLQGGCDVETLRVLGNWKDSSMPLWYADAGDRKHKKRMLNSLPKLDNLKNNGTEKARETKVVHLNG